MRTNCSGLGRETEEAVSYSEFLSRKASVVVPTGIDHDVELAPHLFDFQRDLVQWALRRGRAALFADTGLGKSAMQLEWARHVVAHTSKPVLILAPLAVGPQTVREAERFGSAARMCRENSDVGPGINVLNYDRLHKVDASVFGGVVLDESSILKASDGKTRTALIKAFSGTPFKLCCSATPAPNDHTELGNHAEFLGVMTVLEMLSMFFVHDGGSTQDWRLKGHARRDFWRWVCSWAAMVRKPSDLGYANEGYDLPPLNVQQHTIAASQDTAKAAGRLFVEAANTLAEQREARRASMDERVAKVAELVAAEPNEQWLIWCELNAEGDALKAAIPGAVQVAGADTQEHKEAAMLGFGNGDVRVLVTKAKVAGFGMNWQSCARMAFCGISHSFEQYYQAVRRCWRFGQKRPVDVHVVVSELEGNVVANLERKQKQASEMAEEMSGGMVVETRKNVRGLGQTKDDYNPTKTMKVPSWIRTEAA